MVAVARPDWRVREAALAPDGVTPVYHLVVDTPEGPREVVLKAAREDDHLGVGAVDAEARLLAVVADHTAIPVPDVLGAVDAVEVADDEADRADRADGPDEAADELRTPYFLMESMPGEKVPWPEVGSLPDATLETVARRTGEYLGQLHGIDAPNVDAFGRGVSCEGTSSLRGERPPGDPSELVLSDGFDAFRDQLRDWHEADLDRLADGRFADLVPDLRTALADGRRSLPASLSPVLARMDHGWHNLLLDREADGAGNVDELSAVLDWGSLCAMPPAFDLALVELYLAGGWWLALPEVPDRRRLVREAMLPAYERERTVPAAYEDQRALYQLDVLQAWMQSLDGRRHDGPSMRAIPDDRADDAEAGFRAMVDGLLE